ncbi:MAG: hypothetical protein K9J13_16080 [Saprospiraceae bacterium]|nr:hypothetical protein [Saprospiraceae bacterium]
MDDILSLEHWLELKSRLRQQYPQLTDADLQYHEAVEKDLLAMVEFSLLMRNEIMQANMALCA